MGYQTGIKPVLLDWGLNVREVSGWQIRGSSDFNPRGHVCHHDAIVANWTTPPDILIHGRSGPDPVPGPLCNFGLQSNGTVWLIAAGRANHAGEGSWQGLSGNSTVWGTEANNAGDGLDAWSDAQLEAYYKLCAATCEFSGFSPEKVCGHKEWTRRKIDPAGIDMNHFRMKVRSATKEDFTIMDKKTRAYFDAWRERSARRERAILNGVRKLGAGEKLTQKELNELQELEGETQDEIQELKALLAAAEGDGA